MADLGHLAQYGSFDEFMASYEPSQAAWTAGSGQPLLMFALSNRDTDARTAIATRLLDDGADVGVTLSDGSNMLHVLLARKTHDVEAEVPILRRLIEGGADVNGVAAKFGTPLETAAEMFKFSDETLAPFYDVLLSREDLDLLRESRGRPVIDNLRSLRAKRAILVEKAETYLRERGLV
ncbi:hypothetical protein [Georgenia alba]|uniref:Ankyrin repeat domain-containing protein n=1 Tax=Georgenia alba TaxID=2233858 RepID=A0ABW2Q3C7_9MICO